MESESGTWYWNESAYFHRCWRKIDLYREGLGYGSSHWKTRTAHHKPTNKDENR